MNHKEWETPVLIILTRSLPEDGVLQVISCKFTGLTGPDASDCIPGDPGEAPAACEGLVQS